MDFSLSAEMGPRWIMLITGLGILLSFAAGLSNSIMFYEFLPKDENAEILVFYQPTCPPLHRRDPHNKETRRRWLFCLRVQRVQAS